MAKRKIILFKFIEDLEMYEEQASLNVALHKGLPEIQKNAEREIAKMKREADGLYGYAIMQGEETLVGFTNG